MLTVLLLCSVPPLAADNVPALAPVRAVAKALARPKLGPYSTAHAAATKGKRPLVVAVGAEHHAHGKLLAQREEGELAALAEFPGFAPGVYLYRPWSDGVLRAADYATPWDVPAAATQANAVPPDFPSWQVAFPLPTTTPAGPAAFPVVPSGGTGGGGPVRKAGRWVKKCFGTHCEQVWVED